MDWGEGPDPSFYGASSAGQRGGKPLRAQSPRTGKTPAQEAEPGVVGFIPPCPLHISDSCPVQPHGKKNHSQGSLPMWADAGLQAWPWEQGLYSPSLLHVRACSPRSPQLGRPGLGGTQGHLGRGLGLALWPDAGFVGLAPGEWLFSPSGAGWEACSSTLCLMAWVSASLLLLFQTEN